MVIKVIQPGFRLSIERLIIVRVINLLRLFRLIRINDFIDKLKKIFFRHDDRLHAVEMGGKSLEGCFGNKLLFGIAYQGEVCEVL